jgi:hypothetical protein
LLLLRVGNENLSVFRFGRIIGGLKKQNNRWVVDNLSSAQIARIAYFAQTLPEDKINNITPTERWTIAVEEVWSEYEGVEDFANQNFTIK